MKQVLSIALIWLLAFPLSMMAEKTTSGMTMTNPESANETKKVTVSVYENVLYVSNAKENTTIEVKNMLGENVKVEKVKFPQQRVELNLNRGFYIVRVEDVLQRIVIK